MYSLPYFKEKDEAVVLEFIQQHPFALIAGCDEDSKPVATQIPVFIEKREEKLFLTGHMMRNTDHHKAFEKKPFALCVFTGAHTYVSAMWYSNSHQASTWNYLSVHVRGRLQFLDEAGLVNVLRKTTLHFEDYDQASSTTFDNLSEDYTSRLMKAIVAFEIEVEEMDNVFKLSQNRDEESFGNIIGKLENGTNDDQIIAEEMRKRKDEVYKH